MKTVFAHLIFLGKNNLNIIKVSRTLFESQKTHIAQSGPPLARNATSTAKKKKKSSHEASRRVLHFVTSFESGYSV